jgi:hypothetical protein
MGGIFQVQGFRLGVRAMNEVSESKEKSFQRFLVMALKYFGLGGGLIDLVLVLYLRSNCSHVPNPANNQTVDLTEIQNKYGSHIHHFVTPLQATAFRLIIYPWLGLSFPLLVVFRVTNRRNKSRGERVTAQNAAAAAERGKQRGRG